MDSERELGVECVEGENCLVYGRVGLPLNRNMRVVAELLVRAQGGLVTRNEFQTALGKVDRGSAHLGRRRVELDLKLPIVSLRFTNSVVFGEAKAASKRVIVSETATWYGPCHMPAHFLESHRALREQDYIWIRVKERWNCSDEVMNGIEEGPRGGIPWFAILEGEGRFSPRPTVLTATSPFRASLLASSASRRRSRSLIGGCALSFSIAPL